MLCFSGYKLLFLFQKFYFLLPAFPKPAGSFNFPKSFHPLLCPYATIWFLSPIRKTLSAFCPVFPCDFIPSSALHIFILFPYALFLPFPLVLYFPHLLFSFPPFSCPLPLNASLFSPVPLFLPFQYLAAYFQSIFLHSFTIIFNNAI